MRLRGSASIDSVDMPEAPVLDYVFEVSPRSSRPRFKGPVASVRELWIRRTIITLMAALWGLFAVIILLQNFFGMRVHADGWAFPYMLAAPVLIGVWLQYIWKREYSRNQRSLIAAHLRICPICRYRLEGMSEAGLCPECGTAYAPVGLKIIWCNAYSLKAIPTNTPSKPSSPVFPTTPPGASTT